MRCARRDNISSLNEKGYRVKSPSLLRSLKEMDGISRYDLVVYKRMNLLMRHATLRQAHKFEVNLVYLFVHMQA